MLIEFGPSKIDQLRTFSGCSVNYRLGLAKRRHSGLKEAFSLIELLTTIFIIGVLVSLSVIGFSKTKERAARVHCKGNLRQLGIASRLYADDHEGRFPTVSTPHFMTNGVTIRHFTIRNTLKAFLQDSAVFLCKRDRTDDYQKGGSSYEWNGQWNGRLIDRVGSGQNSSHSEALLSDSEIRHGERNAVFLDGRVGSIEGP